MEYLGPYKVLEIVFNDVVIKARVSPHLAVDEGAVVRFDVEKDKILRFPS